MTLIGGGVCRRGLQDNARFERSMFAVPLPPERPFGFPSPN